MASISRIMTSFLCKNDCTVAGRSEHWTGVAWYLIVCEVTNFVHTWGPPLLGWRINLTMASLHQYNRLQCPTILVNRRERWGIFNDTQIVASAAMRCQPTCTVKHIYSVYTMVIETPVHENKSAKTAKSSIRKSLVLWKLRSIRYIHVNQRCTKSTTVTACTWLSSLLQELTTDLRAFRCVLNYDLNLYTAKHCFP